MHKFDKLWEGANLRLSYGWKSHGIDQKFCRGTKYIYMYFEVKSIFTFSAKLLITMWACMSPYSFVMFEQSLNTIQSACHETRNSNCFSSFTLAPDEGKVGGIWWQTNCWFAIISRLLFHYFACDNRRRLFLVINLQKNK